MRDNIESDACLAHDRSRLDPQHHIGHSKAPRGVTPNHRDKSSLGAPSGVAPNQAIITIVFVYLGATPRGSHDLLLALGSIWKELVEPSRVPKTEPWSAACKASVLPIVLLLWSTNNKNDND